MRARGRASIDPGDRAYSVSSIDHPRDLLVKFASVYFFHYAVLALSLAFFPLFFRARHFSAEEIGLLGTLSVFAAILGQSVGGWMTHQLLSPRQFARFIPSVGIGFLLLLQWSAEPTFLFVFVFLFQACHSAFIPHIDAQTLRYNAQGILRYERVRVFGSLGFIVGSLIAGLVVDQFGEIVILPLTIALLALVLLCVQSVAPQLPAHAERTVEVGSADGQVPSKGAVTKLLVIVALQWASHAALYVYLSVYLRELDWSAAHISLAWNLGVLAEITAFAFLRNFDRVFPLSRVLQFSAGVTVLRWFLLGYFQDFRIILLSQLLHGVSFGSFFIASLKLLDAQLSPATRGKAPAILNIFGHGLGSIAGRGLLFVLASKVVVAGDYQDLFLISAFIALGGFLGSLIFVREPKTC